MNKFWTHPLCHSNISVRIFTSMLVNNIKNVHENIMTRIEFEYQIDIDIRFYCQ